MSTSIDKKEWQKAAENVQREWLDGLEKAAAAKEAPLPDGLEDRLARAWTEPAPAKKPFLRRTFPRIAAAVFAVFIVFGGWLAIDQKARAQVQEWWGQVTNQDRQFHLSG